MQPSSASGATATGRPRCAILRRRWGSPAPASTTPSTTSARSSAGRSSAISTRHCGIASPCSSARCRPRRRCAASSSAASSVRLPTTSGVAAFSSTRRSRSRRTRRARRLYRGAAGEIEGFFARAVARGQEAGTIPADRDAADIARLLLCVTLGIRVLARARPDHELLEGLLRPALALLDPTPPLTGGPTP